MLVILSGVAGAGKDTVKKEIVKRLEYVETFPTVTSRPMRNGDIPGVTYIFVTEEKFKKMIKDDELYEYDIHHNNYYGVAKKPLQEKIQNGKIAIRDVDVNGTENLVKKLGKSIKIITIFLKVSKEELRRRLEEREDNPSEDEINLRLSRFEYEESKIGQYDYVIENNNQEETIKKIINIIEKEKQ
jgi:guanylate kinase